METVFMETESDMETVEKNTSMTIWKIKNYSYSWHTKDECITSEWFPICFKVDVGGLWRLGLYPRGVTASEGFTSIFLVREPEPDAKGLESLCVDYQISVLDSDGTPNHTTEEKDSVFAKGGVCGFPRLMRRVDIIENKSTFLPEDTLTVRCCVSSEWMEPLKPMYNFLQSEVVFQRHLMLLDGGEFNYDTPSKQGIFWEHDIQYGFFSLKLDFDSINIIIKRTNNDPRMFRYRIGILDSTQSTSQFIVDEHTFQGERQTVETYLTSRAKLLRYQDLYLPEGRLILYCEVHHNKGVYTNVIESQFYRKLFLSGKKEWVCGKKKNSSDESPVIADSRCCANNYDSLKNDFQNLYEEGTLSDFSIQVGDETLKVHKAVLCARSSVFKAILRNMQENEENKMDLSVFEMDIVRRMLIFMYTDKADGLNWEAAQQLYLAAVAYDIAMLKRVCLEFLELNLRSANVQDIQTLASGHADEDLEKLVSAFLQRRN